MTMSKKTHVWIFYYVDAIKTTDYVPYDGDSLIYAYTTKKKLAEDFMLTRNMENYFMKEFNLTKDELNDLYNVNMRADLEYMDMMIGYKEIKVPVTLEESKNIRSFYDTMEYKLFQNTWIDVEPLKRKYINALELLLYNAFYRYVYGSTFDPTDGHIRPNYFNIMIDLYRDYFVSDLEKEGEEN